MFKKIVISGEINNDTNCGNEKHFQEYPPETVSSGSTFTFFFVFCFFLRHDFHYAGFFTVPDDTKNPETGKSLSVNIKDEIRTDLVAQDPVLFLTHRDDLSLDALLIS